MLIKRILILLFTFYTVDIKQRSGIRTYALKAETVQELILEIRKRKESQKKRSYQKGKWRKRKKFDLKTFSYKSSRPRDRRFTNQQKLRRMYRNC